MFCQTNQLFFWAIILFLCPHKQIHTILYTPTRLYKFLANKTFTSSSVNACGLIKSFLSIDLYYTPMERKIDPRKSWVDDETENISPHSQKGRNSVHNTGFILPGVLISVHKTGLGVFSVSTKWVGVKFYVHIYGYIIYTKLVTIN